MMSMTAAGYPCIYKHVKICRKTTWSDVRVVNAAAKEKQHQ